MNYEENTLIELLKIYKKIDNTDIHQKFTNQRSMKLATIVNRIFYYVEYINVLIKNKNIENFNYCKYNIVISISRNVMELFNAYEYYAEPNISKSELELRFLCSELHEKLNEEQIHDKLKKYDPNKFDQFNIIYPSSNYKRLIENNNSYKLSTEKWKQSLLSGRKCYYFNRMNTHLNILPKPLESSLYNMFSNYIHSFELALNYDITRGNGTMYSGFYQAILSIQIVTLYSAIVLKNYISKRRLKKVLTPNDIKFIESLICYHQIENTLIKWKNKYNLDF